MRPRGAGHIVVVGAAAGIDLLLWNGDSALRDGQLLPMWVVPALTVVIYPVLLLRWRYPRAVFTLHWTYGLAGLFLPDYVPFAGLLVALHALGRCASTGWAWAGLAACVVPFGVNAYNEATLSTREDRLLYSAGTMMLWAVIVLTVWGLGRLAHTAQQRAEQEKREQAVAAVRAERLRLARELHDIVSHSVSAMILQAAGAQTLVPRDEEQVRAALEAIETTGVHAMGELHRLLGLLRAADPDDDSDGSSAPPSLRDLNTVVSSARASGVEVEVVIDGRPTELDTSVDQAAYRVVQEALTNTIKHAGRGASARVHLEWGVEGLTLTIRDRAGFEPQERAELSSGQGLNGLAERVHLVGGTLETGPVPGGFLLRAHLPARPPALRQVAPITTRQETP